MRPRDLYQWAVSLIAAERPPLAMRLGVYAAFTLVTLLSVYRVVHTYHDPQDDSPYRQGLIDFHNAIYFPALAYGQGINPYGAAYAHQFPVNRQYPLYSPGTLWLNLPFSWPPIDLASGFYFVYSFALVLALAASVLAICRIRLTPFRVLGVATLVLMSRPGHINLMLGQSTLPMVLGAIWAMELARRKPAWAGLALAVTTLKPTFGVPLIWLMFCRRDFRAVFIGVAIGGVAALAGAAPLIAHSGWRPFLDSLRASQSLHEDDPVVTPTSSWTRLDTLSIVGRFTKTNPEGGTEAIVAAIVLLVAGWAVYRSSGSPAGEGADSLSAVIICTASLACIYHSMYDGLLLLAPWLGVTCGRLRGQTPGWAQPVLWVLLAVPAVNYLSTRSAIERFHLDGPAWTLFTSANGVAVLASLLLSAGIVVAMAWRAPVILKAGQTASTDAAL